MSYGVFEVRDDNGKLEEVHVCACDEEGYMVKPHIISMACPCMPEVDEELLQQTGVIQYIHNNEQ